MSKVIATRSELLARRSRGAIARRGLVGVHTERAGTAAAAGEVLNRLTARDCAPGVIAVHSPYLRELGGRWQRRIAQADTVLVIALPEGRTPGGPAQACESLRDLLARAVGYEFTFDPMGSAR
jgi:vacuolar-type H+-ATPase subunit F/Vma7